MIITLKVECIWGIHLEEDCVRVIEIDSKASLNDLHDAIQDAVDFDDDHLFEFFAGRTPRQRKIVYVEDLDYETGADRMSEITLDMVFPLPKDCKLYYNFDFGDNWIFKIGKTRKSPKESEAGVKYPRVIEKIGPNPPQYGSYDDEEW